VEIDLKLPIDGDSYLRRQCPRCEREFKWKHSEDDESATDTALRTEVFCPYCGQLSSTDQCWTNAQVEAAQAAGGTEMLRELENAGFRVSINPPPPPLVEPNDMEAIAPPCHPEEPFKIETDWSEPVHCLACGSAFVV
jgi:uncharacterized Zn-finger protein